MCGIAGIIGGADECDLRVMTQMLAHRGPDEGAFWLDPDGVAGLGHRRLRIIDLSRAAGQPMLSPDGRHIITFNGEIFNHRELRAQLETRGRVFATRSDTEVLLHAWREWGTGVLTRLRGQFAFAVWDTRARSLFAARDHLGIKPFYYHVDGATLVFASEAKAILAVRPATRAVRWSAVPDYLAWLWTPGPDTFFDGIQKLAPGNWLTWSDGRVETGEYWDPVEAMHAAPAADPAELRGRLEKAVASQLESDVPLGLLLSGGIDSTAVLAAMSAGGRPVRAFTARYSRASRRHDVFQDDAHFARVAADRYGASLEMFELEDRVLDILPKALWHCDEPLADPTIVTNYQLTRAAKASHTVLLSGMGADEILAGYPRHPAVLLGERLSFVPAGAFRLLGAALRGATRLGALPISRSRRAMLLVDQLHKPFRERFIGFSSYFSGDAISGLLRDGIVPGEALRDFAHAQRALFDRYRGESMLTRMLAVDLRTFLPCLNLENMDKTSLAHGVEIRVPFLDHTFVEYCLALPDASKLARGRRKVALRDAFGDLPPEILRRPKTGYSPPVRGWVRTSLAEAISGTLLSRRSLERGIWRRAEVERMLRENAAGARDHSMRIWTMYVLERWCALFVDGAFPAPGVSPDLLERVGGAA